MFLKFKSFHSFALTAPLLGVYLLKHLRNAHWKDWCWSWSPNTLATWCKELTHWKRLWCWEGLKAGGEGDDRRWDGWMASPTWWTRVWASSGSWWRTGRPGVLQSMGSQRVEHDWVTELIIELGQGRREISKYKRRSLRTSWWSSGKESALQCRGPRFDPWLGN